MTAPLLPPAGTPGETCEPTYGTDPGTYHWLQHVNGRMEVMEWFQGAWCRVMEPVEVWPHEAVANGYRYLCPVTPPRTEGQDEGAAP